ncbi:AraC family transcriptional regulator [Sulfuriflexus mobilis]|uniref:AraC family transcriptional regulator n=1 Tax=Sulfuriflexus mobilis TaxID=1811807 RepID=UPI000F83E741|nr:helix-turn-helix domain-containing protein [Sulfuriflexus mobilis]
MSKLYIPFQPTLTEAGLGQFGLTLQSKQPCDVLKGKVHSYLQISAKRPTPYPVIPDGTQAIYFSSQGLMIGGAQIEARDIQLLEPGEYFGIWFYPGALRYFFELNLSEISGQFVDEKYFQCRYIPDLHAEIYRYTDFVERANICDAWLLRRYSDKPVTKFDIALQQIYQSFGSEKISELANKVGWSSRHLNRQFLQHTGLSTKSFSQIIRVQSVCKELYVNPNQPLSAVLELGYFDQPHLIKEFKKHLISTPGDFFSRFMSDLYNR